jgi:hypothetical protein
LKNSVIPTGASESEPHKTLSSRPERAKASAVEGPVFSLRLGAVNPCESVQIRGQQL